MNQKIIIGGIVVIALGYGAYKYFNSNSEIEDAGANDNQLPDNNGGAPILAPQARTNSTPTDPHFGNVILPGWGAQNFPLKLGSGMRNGSRSIPNTYEQAYVRRIQRLINENCGKAITINGLFDQSVEDALKACGEGKQITFARYTALGLPIQATESTKSFNDFDDDINVFN